MIHQVKKQPEWYSEVIRREAVGRPEEEGSTAVEVDMELGIHVNIDN